MEDKAPARATAGGTGGVSAGGERSEDEQVWRTSLFTPMRLTREQIEHLLAPFCHSLHLRRHRASLVITRVQMVAALFAALVPVWVVADFAAYPFPEWALLALLRGAAAVMLAALAWPWPFERRRLTAVVLLVSLMLIPPVFYVLSAHIVSGVEYNAITPLINKLYSLLPYAVVAGMSVFPLTAIEVLVLAIPVFAVTAYGSGMNGLSAEELVSNLWMLMLVTGASMISGMSQLQYIIALVNRASFDGLTGAFTRRTGAETLDLQFRLASMQNQHLAVVFIDIDDFKSINDTYGHERGDEALRRTAECLRGLLRRGDTLVRWGGEEFLLILANTDAAGARIVAQRILTTGFGARPDGAPLTVSVGVCERLIDRPHDWPEFVELADRRMYAAKKAGKNRAVLFDDEVLVGAALAPM